MKDITPKQTTLPAVFKKIPAWQLTARHRLGAGITAAAGRALGRHQKKPVMNSFSSAKSTEV